MAQKDNNGKWTVRIWKFLKFVIFMSLLVGLCYYLGFKTDIFIVKDIEITCNSDKTEILFESFDKHFKGENIFLISMKEAEVELVENPYVHEIKIKRKFPDKIGFDAVLRKERVAFTYNNLLLFLDKDGVVLRISEENEEHLTLHGFPVKSFVIGRKLELTNEKELENSLLLVNLIEQSKFELRPNLVYTNGNIMLILNEDMKVNFGNGSEIEENYNEFIDIYNDLKTKGIKSGLIDVGHKGYPVYKPFGE